ncbi:hypothetical protein EVAR_92805_1 [Eumeta japonica]|uniref:Uncharacterized protein n=1 Tax=Eumeta variegata TaxID=151549 RepID=A0A4C2A3S4_EUMVA|nr:hypothetical protein EVAR_92805_1 [Eumeta japonica]
METNPARSSRDSSSYPSVCSSKPSLSYNKVSEQSDGMIKDWTRDKNPGRRRLTATCQPLPSIKEATVTEATQSPTINSKT